MAARSRFKATWGRGRPSASSSTPAPMDSRRIPRRDFLKGAGALGLAGLAWPLAACGPLGGAPRAAATNSPVARSGSTPIKHVIVDVQENRSFDHYYGFAPFAGSYGIPVGFEQPDGHGGFVRPFHFQSLTTNDI